MSQHQMGTIKIQGGSCREGLDVLGVRNEMLEGRDGML